MASVLVSAYERNDAGQIGAVLGDGFVSFDTRWEEHRTPSGAVPALSMPWVSSWSRTPRL